MIDENTDDYFVALFFSVSHVMKAEKILQKADMPFKMIPVPKTISTDCGVCIKFERRFVERFRSILEGAVEIKEIIPYC